MDKKITQLKLILIIGFIQFFDILDFMVVMPLGPDYAKDLAIDQSKLGYSALCYTIAAAFSGIFLAPYLDKYERKKALILIILGLACASFLGSFAKSFHHLLFTRIIAGFFGGPLTAISYAIISDLTPEKSRGYVIGKVMSAFSFAAIIGVPISLEISLLFGWQKSFLFVTLIGMCAIILAYINLPTMKTHISENVVEQKLISLKNLFANKIYILAFCFSFLGMMALFMIIPYISGFLQSNLNFPREYIGPLYFIGGVSSFITVQFIGKIIDNNSSSKIAYLATLILAMPLLFVFTLELTNKLVFIAIFYAMLMIGIAIRNVSNSALATKIARKNERAGFMLLISTFQSIASGLGSYTSSIILHHEILKDKFYNMYIISIIIIILLLISSWLMSISEQKLTLPKKSYAN